MDKAKKDGKPFFIWHNTTRMHAYTFVSPKYQAMMNSESNYGLEEAGIAQLDDSVGALLKHLQDIGQADNTIVIFTTDNGAEVFTWPDGGMTPFKATKGTVFEGGFRVPCIIRWPGKVKPGSVENGIFSGLDWLPPLAAAAGNPNITEQLLKGVTLDGRTYKNHLVGYNQLDLLLGKGPSTRHEIFYFEGPKPAVSFGLNGQVHRVQRSDLGQNSDFLPLIRLALKAGMRRKRTGSGRGLETMHAEASANKGDEHAMNHRKSRETHAKPHGTRGS